MKETERIATQLERSLNGEAWHGPALLELLAGVTPEDAAARPVAGWHSIWELALHVTVWQDVARRRLGGEPVRFTIGGPEDWPPVTEPSAAAFAGAIGRLRDSTAALAAAIRALPESRLDQPILETFALTYDTLHGVVQHNLYHAGQIAVLKRALGRPALASSQG